MLKRISVRIIMVLSAAIALAACGGLAGTKNETAGPTVTPLVVRLPTDTPATPTAAALSTRLTTRAGGFNVKATGTIVSAKQATLSFAITGRVKEIFVEEGAKIRTGVVVAALDTGSLEATVAQANAAFELAKAGFLKVKAGPNADEILVAKANVDRAKAALDQAQAAYDRIGGAANPASGLSPQALALQQATITYQAALGAFNLAVNHPTEVELAVAGAQLAQASAALEAAKTTLGNARIIAPFDGTVLNFNPKIGESVSANSAVATLADLTKMQAIVNLDENSLTGIKLGQSVNLTVDALGGRTLNGKVRKIGLLGTAATGVVSVPVTIDIDPTDAPIYPGLSATVEFQVGQ